MVPIVSVTVPKIPAVLFEDELCPVRPPSKLEVKLEPSVAPPNRLEVKELVPELPPREPRDPKRDVKPFEFVYAGWLIRFYCWEFELGMKALVS